MFISIDTCPDPWDWDILLDGKPVGEVIAADSDYGWLMKYVREGNCIRVVGHTPVKEILRGKVEIKRKAA